MRCDERPAVARVERLLQVAHALDVAVVRRGVVVDEELCRLAHALGHRLEHREPRLERWAPAARSRGARRPRCQILPSSGRDVPSMMRSRLDLPVPLRPDEADALARLDDEVGVVEQRHVAVTRGETSESWRTQRGTPHFLM
jgi:hypothetical protein